MLDTLRGAAKSWVAKILIGLLAISFGIFWGIQDVFRGYRSDTLASVGDEDISIQQFNRQLQQTLQEYSRQTGQSITPDMAHQIGLDRQVLNDLLRGAALDSDARKLKLAVSDQQLAAAAQELPMFQGIDGKFDPEMFRAVLRRNNMTEQMYFASERRRFLQTAIASSASAGLAIPATMVEAAYRHRNEERDARYFVVTAAETEVPAPSDDDLKKYYDDNPQAYTAPEYRALVVMKAEPADLAARIVVSDDELNAAYEKYKADYSQPESRVIEQIVFPTLEEAQKAKQRMAAGEDFMVIAKEHGLTETSVSLGDRRKDDIADQLLADAAFALAQGTVSDPIQGKLSISLVRVTKITPAEQKTLDQVKAELTSRLQLDHAREELLNIYNAVEDARAAQTKFEDIAEKAKLPIVIVSAVDSRGQDKDGKPVELPYKDEVLQAAFASDVGVENDALQSGDAYIWYEVREVTPAALRPLAEIKDKVKADYLASKLRDLAIDKARKLAERGAAGTPLESLAQESGAEIKTVQGLKRNETSPDFDAQAIAAVFSVPENGFTFAAQPDGKGAKLIQSQAVLMPPFDASSAEAKTLSESLARGAGNDLTGMYIAAIETELGTSIDEALWSKIVGTANP